MSATRACSWRQTAFITCGSGHFLNGAQMDIAFSRSKTQSRDTAHCRHFTEGSRVGREVKLTFCYRKCTVQQSRPVPRPRHVPPLLDPLSTQLCALSCTLPCNRTVTFLLPCPVPSCTLHSILLCTSPCTLPCYLTL